MIAALTLLAMFPFIGIPGSNFDVQPWFIPCLVVLTIFTFFRFGRAGSVTLHSIPLILLFSVFSIIIMIVVGDYRSEAAVSNFNLFLAARQSLSWLVIPLFIYVMTIYNVQLNRYFLYFVVAAWMFVGLVQLFDQNFMVNFLPRNSTSESRGVVSLGPEPFEYSRILIIQMVLTLTLSLEGKISKLAAYAIYILCSLQIIVLARAGTGLVLLMGFFVLYALLFSRNMRVTILRMVSVSIIFSIVLYLGVTFFPGWRVFAIVSAVIENPEFLASQGGFVGRFYNVPLSIWVGLYEYGPFGFGFGIDLKGSQVVTFELPFKVERALGHSAHGGVVGAVYSGGVIGFIWVVCLLRLFRVSASPSITKFDARVARILMLCALLVSFFEGSIANPSVGFLYGYIINFLFRRDLLIAKPIYSRPEKRLSKV